MMIGLAVYKDVKTGESLLGNSLTFNNISDRYIEAVSFISGGDQSTQ